MSAATRFGRFTARGGPEVEAEIGALVTRAGDLVRARVPSGAYRALVLLGGYGRGEGGVERREGVERPHNNLDLLLVTTGRGDGPALKRLLDELFLPLARASGVGIDVGVIGALRLRLAPCLVMWFDMRFGHKTLAGDASFVPSLTRFHAGAIEPADVRDLVVNRGSLLVINDALLARGAQGALAAGARRTLVKHAMKAVIGYGDALLFSRGAYTWSYLEKQRRMRARRDVPADVRALYDEAVEFRFQPSYERYIARDPGPWLDDLRARLAPVHLGFERWRLGAPDLTWDEHPRLALAHELRVASRSPRALVCAARAARNLWEARRAGAHLDLALAAASPRARLAAAFPVVLYGAGCPSASEVARRIVGAPAASLEALRLGYLERWGAHGDVNFSAAAHGVAPVAEHA
jgi:hypothetical protein